MNLHTLREHPYSPGRSLAVLISIMLTVTVLSFILWKNDPLIAEEGHAIELAESILLLLACFMHGERAFHLEMSVLNFYIHAGLALLTYSFALRELDIDQFGTSEIWPLVERVFRIAGVVLWVVFFIILMPRIKQIFSRRSAILVLPVMLLTIWGGLFYIASWPFDKELFSTLPHDYSRFIEEVLELNAGVILFAASLANSSLQSSASKV